jgi:hypothetical protein
MATITMPVTLRSWAEPGNQDQSQLMEVDEAMSIRYLQFDCKYRMCKYRDEGMKTWGALIKDDYKHFVFLMSTEVGNDSNTFLALSPFLREEDKLLAQTCTRRRDTPEGKETINIDFLNLICSHKGRMNGLTWGSVRQKDYSYFTWAVGNTMNRDTKSFSVFFNCLDAQGQKLVNSAPKGQVKVPKGLKFTL